MIKTIKRFQAFVFSMPTKNIELMTGVLGIGFAVAFLTNGESLINQEIYTNFKYIHDPKIWLGMLFLSILQLRFMCSNTLESNIKSSLTLKAAFLMWISVAALFGSKVPPLNTGVVVYPVIAFLCLMASFNLDIRVKSIELVHKECRKNA